MSTVRVDNIQDNGSGFNDVVSFQNVSGTENGRLCRAFVNFNGTSTVAIRGNFNVNSITDNATGDYTVNFANAMSDANYAVMAGATGAWGTNNTARALGIAAATSPTSSAVRIVNIGFGGAEDISFAGTAIFR